MNPYTETIGCTVCATAFTVGKYGAGMCPTCGQRHGYDENYAIVLSATQRALLLHHRNLHRSIPPETSLMTIPSNHMQIILELLDLDILAIEQLDAHERTRLAPIATIPAHDTDYLNSLRLTLDALRARRTTYAKALAAEQAAPGSGFEPPVLHHVVDNMPTAARLHGLLRSVSGNFQNLIPWRGSASDVATDLAEVMSRDQMERLCRELQTKIDQKKEG